MQNKTKSMNYLFDHFGATGLTTRPIKRGTFPLEHPLALPGDQQRFDITK